MTIQRIFQYIIAIHLYLYAQQNDLPVAVNSFIINTTPALVGIQNQYHSVTTSTLSESCIVAVPISTSFAITRRQIQQCTISHNVGSKKNNLFQNYNSCHPTALFGKKDARAEGNDRKNKTERVRKVKDDVIEIEGVVVESLPNAMFRCSIDGAPDTQEPILATISGKIRKNMVKILVGDKVLIELSPYDLTRGRITFRYR